MTAYSRNYLFIFLGQIATNLRAKLTSEKSSQSGNDQVQLGSNIVKERIIWQNRSDLLKEVKVRSSQSRHERAKPK